MDVTTVISSDNVKTVENKGVSNTVEPIAIRMNNSNAPIIEDWSSDYESEVEPNNRIVRPILSIYIMCVIKRMQGQCGTTQEGSGKLSTVGAAVNTVRPVTTANTKAVNIVRLVNIVASKPIMSHPRPKTNTYKRGYSQISRPFNRHFANKNSIINTNVNTARVKHTTAMDRAVVSENKGKGANAVKASACWVWKAKNSSASTTFKKYSYIDARGRSKMHLPFHLFQMCLKNIFLKDFLLLKMHLLFHLFQIFNG
ncbi:hypothetical protein Tco_1579425 [Tanacetum coccineum]